MAKVLNKEFQLPPYSFLGLLASDGQVPGAESGSTDRQFIVIAVEDTVREMASDLTAKGSFFSLMVDNGMMSKVKPAKKYNAKIVRPTSLGGGLGGNFGGSALAH